MIQDSSRFKLILLESLKLLKMIFFFNDRPKLTVVAAVPGQPLSFRTVGGSDDADVVARLDRQVVFTALCCDHDCRLV